MYRFEEDADPVDMCVLYLIRVKASELRATAWKPNHEDEEGYDNFIRMIPEKDHEEQLLFELDIYTKLMNTTPFQISYKQNGIVQQAEIRPCCREDHIVDYAVYTQGKLAFTITRNVSFPNHWVVAMKNAADDINEERVQLIGAEIDKKKSG